MQNFVAYPAIYSDHHGREETIVYNDAKNLSMRLRGVVFSGTSFDDFEPATGSQDLSTFTLNRTDLCDCELQWQMPVLLATPDGTKLAILHCTLILGKPAPNGGIDSLILKLTLTYGDLSLTAEPEFGYFEDALLILKKQLPQGYALKSCITCAFSDYHPGGNGLFGDLMCFRGNKDAYRKVNSKFDLFDLLDAPTEFLLVQETYLCPEYEVRPPDTGYRG